MACRNLGFFNSAPLLIEAANASADMETARNNMVVGVMECELSPKITAYKCLGHHLERYA